MARVLIVEPHADIRALLEHVVKRLGHEPVLSDWHDTEAPAADIGVIEPGDPQGIPYARQLREQGRPVVFASIFPATSEALDLEPVAYFIKPFALNDLETAVEAALQRDELLA